MRCPLVPLLLVTLSTGCAREAARPRAPIWTAAPPPVAAAPPPAEPVAWTPPTPPHAAARSNLIGVPAPGVRAPRAPRAPAIADTTTEDPPIARDTSDVRNVQPPAEDIAALKRMLRRAPAPHIARRSSARIPDGSACLEMLDRYHLPYSRLAHVEGIKTPISVKGPIGGIRYHSWGTRPLVADCRFVVALEWIAPVLKQIGVTEVRDIGTYAYRMARVGRLSLHAYGLAIDILGFVVNGRMYKVSDDFRRGMGKAGCSPAAPVLDEISCRVKEMGLFREVLTPDSNADHASHFHFGILPTGMTLAMLPRYLPGRRRHHHHHHHETKLADQTAPKHAGTLRAGDKLAKTDDEPSTDTRRAEKSRRHHKASAKRDKHDKRVARNDRHKHHVARDDKHDKRAEKRLARNKRHAEKRDRQSRGHSSAVARAGRHAAEHARHSTAHADKREVARARKHSARRHSKAGEHLAKRDRHSAKSRHHAATHHDKRVAARAKKPRAEHHRDAERHHDKRVAARTKKPHAEHHRDAERHRDTHEPTAERHRHHGRSRERGR